MGRERTNSHLPNTYLGSQSQRLGGPEAMTSEDYHRQPYHMTSESGGEHDVTPPEDRVCGFCTQGHAEGLEVSARGLD